MRGLDLAMLAWLMPIAAQADTTLACMFETVPDVVLTYPQDASLPATMQVGARPPANMVVGQGSTRLESAEIDGYRFRFSPFNLSMDVEKDGDLVLNETGRCVTIGGPANATPLSIGAPKPETTEPEPVPQDLGEWAVSLDKSQIDDSESVFLSLSSTEMITGQFGGSGYARLLLRCMENSTNVLLMVNDHFLTDIQGFGTVTYRIDDQKAGKLRMGASTDNKALGLWDGGSAIPFIKKLEAGTKIVFRVTPFNESPIEFSMNISGLTSALAPLRKACKW